MGVAFDGIGITRQVAFDGIGIKRRVTFGGCGLTKGGLLYYSKTF